jgi:hypothetical protein
MCTGMQTSNYWDVSYLKGKPPSGTRLQVEYGSVCIKAFEGSHRAVTRCAHRHMSGI